MHPSKTSTTNFSSHLDDVVTAPVNMVRPFPLYTANAFAIQTRNVEKYLTSTDKELLPHAYSMPRHDTIIQNSNIAVASTVVPPSSPKVHCIHHRPHPQTAKHTPILFNSIITMPRSPKVKCVRQRPRPQLKVYTLKDTSPAPKQTISVIPIESPNPATLEPPQSTICQANHMAKQALYTTPTHSLDSQSSPEIPSIAFARSDKLLELANLAHSRSASSDQTTSIAIYPHNTTLRPDPLHINFKGKVAILH